MLGSILKNAEEVEKMICRREGWREGEGWRDGGMEGGTEGGKERRGEGKLHVTYYIGTCTYTSTHLFI